MANKKNIWNEAGRAAIVLGCIPIIHLLLSNLTSMIKAPVLVGILSFVLWAAKFIFCIWFMREIMKKYVDKDNEATNSDTFRLGMATALLSALIWAAFYLCYVLYIAPDTFTEAIDIMKESYSSMMDANTMDQLDEMMAKMPVISFFAQLIYCWLYGTIVSAILSRNIPSQNPFVNQKED